MRHRVIGRVDQTPGDWSRVERLAGTLRLYGYDAAASNAQEICQGLGARETDLLISSFGQRHQLARVLCGTTSTRHGGVSKKSGGSSAPTSLASPSKSSRRSSIEALTHVISKRLN